MIKNDSWIVQFGRSGGIEPFDEKLVNPASYDVTLGAHWIVPKRPSYLPEKSNGDFIIRQSSCATFYDNVFILEPGQLVLATTLEYIKMPRCVCADLKLKSTVGRSWIQHSLAGWVDPGFEGNITLELQNLGSMPYTLERGQPLAQLIFIQMEQPPLTAYGEGGRGRYQGQRGATRAVNYTISKQDTK